MKKNFFYLAAITLLFFVTISCNKKDDNSENPANSEKLQKANTELKTKFTENYYCAAKIESNWETDINGDGKNEKVLEVLRFLPDDKGYPTYGWDKKSFYNPNQRWLYHKKGCETNVFSLQNVVYDENGKLIGLSPWFKVSSVEFDPTYRDLIDASNGLFTFPNIDGKICNASIVEKTEKSMVIRYIYKMENEKSIEYKVTLLPYPFK